MEENKKKKNIIVLGVCSLILIAMVVAITIGSQEAGVEAEAEGLAASRKAIESVCQPTTYKKTCVESLSASNATHSSDPRQLIQVAFNVTMNDIRASIKNSTLYTSLKDDPRSKLALQNCEELANHAIDDLQRTLAKFQDFDVLDLDNWLDDLKTWLSGSLTYQETCLSGFEEIPGNEEKQMREVLTKSMEMTSNALAMVTEVSSLFTSLEVENVTNKRRLLSKHRDDFSDWVSSGRRRLLTASLNEVKPNLIVAKDGSGNYTSINEALKNIPTKSEETFILYIKEGVYEEQVTIYRNITHLTMIGDGSNRTRITGWLNFIDGVSTYHTATVAVLGDYFMARDIGFENSAGPEKHQAVALRVGADKSIFYNCKMDGYQDTLYAHTYRQFYRNCEISGTIDFIFGDSAAVLQNCTIVVRKPLENQQNIVTAQGRKDPHQPTGLVLQNCTIVADPAYFPHRFTLKSYLGRPWKEFSRTVIMESYIPDFIQPEGWLPWMGDFGLETLFYTEFNNRGPGSSKENRVNWAGIKELPKNQIKRFTAGKFIDGHSWIRHSGVPYNPGLIYTPPKKDKSVKYSHVDEDDFKDMGSKEKEAYASRPVQKSISVPPFPAPASAPAPAPASAETHVYESAVEAPNAYNDWIWI
ncbi:unnamed protein product [Cuscuta campestris]|uniref:Pectinesterase n=1 Tax=Cuscuta campestris TaxID=132261 RepID=A0A484MA92_9ASTE|nr:unnamed protein product [Cuscuta campestris]